MRCTLAELYVHWRSVGVYKLLGFSHRRELVGLAVLKLGLRIRLVSTFVFVGGDRVELLPFKSWSSARYRDARKDSTPCVPQVVGNLHEVGQNELKRPFYIMQRNVR